eukprot:scaffold118655_cov16-Tisochrysis_lutea.AAC.2
MRCWYARASTAAPPTLPHFKVRGANPRRLIDFGPSEGIMTPTSDQEVSLCIPIQPIMGHFSLKRKDHASQKVHRMHCKA